ncbi:MAG: chemotaxis protein, partial [Exiguobacterium sp.]|nr:chemotaxis protein [Exiguobacterium sp.]
MPLFRKTTSNHFVATPGFPDIQTIAKPSDSSLNGRTHYMGYTTSQVKRLQDMAPLVESVLDNVLENVLD